METSGDEVRGTDREVVQASAGRRARRWTAAALARTLVLLAPAAARVAAQTPAETAPETPEHWLTEAEAGEARAQSSPHDGRAWLRWGRALLELGEPAEALPVLERADRELAAAPLQRGLARFALARTQAALGAREAALDWLARALQWGFSDLAAFERDPALGALAQEATYQRLHAELRASREPHLMPDLLVALEPSVAPNPFRAQGKSVLSYDLFLANLWPLELGLEELQVLDADSGAQLASYSGAALSNLFGVPGVRPAPAHIALAENVRLAASLWVELDPSAPLPRHLVHRARFSGTTPWKAPFQPVVEGGRVSVGPPAPVLGAPLRGEGWVARASGSGSYHRRGQQAFAGELCRPQRFAVDWGRAEDVGLTPGDGLQNESFAAFGQEVLAVADGTVVALANDFPDNVPGEPPLVLPNGTAFGNHVVLDLGEGRFANYAHLQSGSVRVRVGERVRRGQVLAHVGNSGDATGPHLHFHLSTGASPYVGQGLAYTLEDFVVLGREDPRDVQAGKPARRDPDSSDRRRGEMPTDNLVLRFR